MTKLIIAIIAINALLCLVSFCLSSGKLQLAGVIVVVFLIAIILYWSV